MKRKKSIGKAAIILILGTIVSKVLGFIRELAVAYKFGAGSITDAFVLTNSIPSIIFVSIGTAVEINYIPYFQKLKSKDVQNRFTSNLLNVIVIILLLGSMVVNIFPELILYIFAAGLPGPTKRYSIVMLRIVMFSIVPIIVSHLFQAYAQANGIFATTALFGIVTNLMIILTTLLSTESTYWFLSIGTILANTAGMLVAAAGAWKGGFRYSFLLEPLNSQMKTLFILTLPLTVENIASSMSLIVDRNLASFLDSGTIAGLSYAGTLGNIAGNMISVPIITAAFPTYAKLLAEGDRDSFEKEFKKYADVILFLLCPVAAMMVFYAADIVVFIFEHGAFSSTASKIVWESMACYAIGIVPSGMQSYLIRAFYAIGDTKAPVKIKVFALLCNIVLNLAAVRVWKHIGIAMSTSISFGVAYGLLAYFLKKKYQIQSVGIITRNMLTGIVSSVAAAIVPFVVFHSNFLPVKSLFWKLVLESGMFIVCYLMVVAATNRNAAVRFWVILKKYMKQK